VTKRTLKKVTGQSVLRIWQHGSCIRLGQLWFKIFCFGCILSLRWVCFILIDMWQGIFWYSWRAILTTLFLWPIYWLSKTLASFSELVYGSIHIIILDLDSCNHSLCSVHHQFPLCKVLKLGGPYQTFTGQMYCTGTHQESVLFLSAPPVRQNDPVPAPHYSVFILLFSEQVEQSPDECTHQESALVLSIPVRQELQRQIKQGRGGLEPPFIKKNCGPGWSQVVFNRMLRSWGGRIISPEPKI
jgi:hypothetical protein